MLLVVDGNEQLPEWIARSAQSTASPWALKYVGHCVPLQCAKTFVSCPAPELDATLTACAGELEFIRVSYKLTNLHCGVNKPRQATITRTSMPLSAVVSSVAASIKSGR